MTVDDQGRAAGTKLRAFVWTALREPDSAHVARQAHRRRRVHVALWGLAAIALVAGVFRIAPTNTTRVEFGAPGGVPSGPYFLGAPPPGETVATSLPNRAPVFVVRHQDGAVTVVSAIDPHLEDLIVWCTRNRAFVEPIGASRFDERGRYVFGPAPTGLAAYDATLTGDGRVRVGQRLPPPERTVQASAIDQGGRCLQDGSGSDVVRHDPQQLPPVIDPAAATGDGRFVRVEGVFSVPSQGVPRLCSTAAAAASPNSMCPLDAWEVTSAFFSRSSLEELAGSAKGTFIARKLADGRFAELAGPMGAEHVRREVPQPAEVGTLAGVVTGVETDGGTTTLVFAEPVAPKSREHSLSPRLSSRKSRWIVRPGAQIFDHAAANPSGAITLEALAESIRRTGEVSVSAEVDTRGEITFVLVD